MIDIPHTNAVNPALIGIGTLQRPNFFNGRRTEVVEVYEDDYQRKQRRVIRVTVVYNGVARKPAPYGHELEVVLCCGYDQVENQWGGESYTTRRVGLEPAEALYAYQQLKDWVLATLEPYNGGPTHYRPTGWVNPSIHAERG